MTAQILDGKALAKQMRSEIAEEVRGFTATSGVVPALAAVLRATPWSPARETCRPNT